MSCVSDKYTVLISIYFLYFLYISISLYVFCVLLCCLYVFSMMINYFIDRSRWNCKFRKP